MRIIPGPAVQLGLDLQYPALRHIHGVLQLVGIHRRPPGIPLPALPTCWPPSPCARLSRARTTTGPPPHPAPSADDGPIPRLRVDPGQRERRGRVPVFTANRSISLAPSFAPAASPRLRRRPSPCPPRRHAKPASESTTHLRWPCTASRPISTRFEPVPRLRSFNTGSSRIPSDPARRTRPVWQYQTVPALSALLPALTGVSRIDCAQLLPGCCDSPARRSCTSFDSQRLTAHQRLTAQTVKLTDPAGRPRCRRG